ncbi:MAG TPA: SWIM zinc finger family protein [Methanoregulaceae archaeon]|nr:SWIM zinc finger family protein [Methanoregulaceae archaeon]
MDIDDFWDQLKAEGDLKPRLSDKVIRLYGERGRKALMAINEGQIKKYLDFFVVVGKTDEYVVDDDFCTCNDFIFRGGQCWHIIAVRIAAITGTFESFDLWYQDVWSEQ